MTKGQEERFLQSLIENNALDSSLLEDLGAKIKNDENFKLINFILSENLISEDKLTELKANFFNLPYYPYVDEVIEENALNFIPEEIAKTYNIVCLERAEGKIKVGMIEPNLKAMEAVNFLALGSKLKVEYYLISNSAWQKIIKQYQKMEEEIFSALETKAKEEGDEIIAIQDETNVISDDDLNSAPVARIVSVIIRHAVDAKASDIHIEPFDKESRVRYRIDGILHTSLTLPKSIHNAIVARIKVMAKLKLDETRIPQDGRIRLLVNNRPVDFRISTLPLASQEKVVMRILDTFKGAPSLEELGFNKHTLRQIHEALKKTSGIILVTGPTGSGKTTSLYAMLNILNQEEVNISTLEDPIEYEIKGINQSQVRPKVGFTFAKGLRSLLRQDPNVIMVGEIRDEETAELSIHASLTGHLVLSTLHTNDAIGAVFRLIDMKVEHFLLASTLKTVLAQRLSRRLCDRCKKEREISDEEFNNFVSKLEAVPRKIKEEELGENADLSDKNKFTIYEAVGCSHCEKTGFKGRVGISEIIDINDELKKHINEANKNLDSKMLRENQDFISIEEDGIIKVLQGVTTMDEVLRVIES